MKTIEETRDWLLENRVDKDGDLNLSDLDFSNFEGNVYISNMKVENNLYQSSQKVKGDLCQSEQEVKRNLFQSHQKVNCGLYQYKQEVKGDFITQTLKDNEEYKINEYGDNYIVKKAKKYTYEELKEKLGHDFEIVEKEENK